MSKELGNFSVRTYSLLTKLYPREFNSTLRADSVATFAEEHARLRSQGRYASFAYSSRNIVALIGEIIRMRLITPPGGRRRNTNGTHQPYESILRELRMALRSLLRTPGFSATAIATMATVIGATTAVFSVVNGILLQPLPYADSEQLVRVYQQNSPTNRFGVSTVDFQGIQQYTNSLSSVAGFAGGEMTLAGPDRSERVPVGRVTPDWFNVLGVTLTHGRAFQSADGNPGNEPVVIVTDAFASRRFESASQAIGETLTLNGMPHTLVGVLPTGMEAMAGFKADVWPVLQLNEPQRRGPFFIRAIGRMRNEVSLEDLTNDLRSVSQLIFPQWSDTFSDENATLVPFALRDNMVGSVKGAMGMLLGAVGFLMLIAIANVGNLFMARSTVRQRETAIRASLGASRTQLLYQFFVESLLLTAIAGGIGIVLASIGLDALVAIGPAIPRLDEVGLDLTALAFAAGIAGASGLFFGVTPFVTGRTESPSQTLRTAGRTNSDTGAAKAMRSALVSIEFALALPLLATAALLFGSLARLHKIPLGFDDDNTVVATLSLPAVDYPDSDARIAFWETALEALQTVPNFSNATFATGLPPDGGSMSNNFDLLEAPVAVGQSEHVAPWITVGPSFFETMEIPLLQGRLPDQADANGPPVAMVSRAWANRYFPDREVLGAQFYEGGCRSCDPTTVIGVVGNVSFMGIGSDDLTAVYRPHSQFAPSRAYVIVRAHAGLPSAAVVREKIFELDRGLALSRFDTFEKRLSDSVARPRYWATLVAVFAVVGVVLAGIGVFGVLSYFVTRQMKEIGVRVALGADPRSVRNLVVRRGMVQALRGLAVGVAVALGLGKSIDSLLYEVTANDPATLGVVSITLALIALAACYVPAHRATQVDPTAVLSQE